MIHPSRPSPLRRRGTVLLSIISLGFSDKSPVICCRRQTLRGFFDVSTPSYAKAEGAVFLPPSATALVISGRLWYNGSRLKGGRAMRSLAAIAFSFAAAILLPVPAAGGALGLLGGGYSGSGRRSRLTAAQTAGPRAASGLPGPHHPIPGGGAAVWPWLERPGGAACAG